MNFAFNNIHRTFLNSNLAKHSTNISVTQKIPTKLEYKTSFIVLKLTESCLI